MIFWHPWDPWGCVHIDLNKNSVRSGCVSPSVISHCVYSTHCECSFVLCFGFYMLKLILWTFFSFVNCFGFPIILKLKVQKSHNWGTVPEISKGRPNFMFICNLSKSFRDKLSLNLETRRQKCLQSQEIEQPASLLQPRSISKSSTNKMQSKYVTYLLKFLSMTN